MKNTKLQYIELSQGYFTFRLVRKNNESQFADVHRLRADAGAKWEVLITCVDEVEAARYGFSSDQFALVVGPEVEAPAPAGQNSGKSYSLRRVADGLWVSSPTNTLTDVPGLRACFGSKWGDASELDREATRVRLSLVHGELEIVG